MVAKTVKSRPRQSAEDAEDGALWTEIGARVKSLRIRLRLTQGEFAAAIGALSAKGEGSAETVSRWETGERTLQLKHLIAIVETFPEETSADELLGFSRVRSSQGPRMRRLYDAIGDIMRTYEQKRTQASLPDELKQLNRLVGDNGVATRMHSRIAGALQTAGVQFMPDPSIHWMAKGGRDRFREALIGVLLHVEDEVEGFAEPPRRHLRKHRHHESDPPLTTLGRGIAQPRKARRRT
jgi:transcriptional regulator with XRE-family HTH domain